jgi:hypothetical protein
LLITIVNNLHEKKREFLRHVLQSKRAETNAAERKTQARKIVKAGTRKIYVNPNPPQQ